ncbi:hypothetical protein HNV08_05655 [Winogradskyella eckloniae]|uniref:beta strand repeat-containing protein n=1 Tax=Winogradskyella eckloniae TaxID=1089306 RepID=UPI00156612ED|nr:hypothetical protein [Winogradskyella eckloniae]NRD19524.1 hypothetical protein [Winogradskyella eckloniae]
MKTQLPSSLKIVMLFLGFCTYSNAQVGIGTTTPNPSSILDIESNTQGILIPRVALTSTNDTTTITDGNIESLLVYNTQLINDIQPGYYYWDNSQWVRLAAGSNLDNQSITNFSVIGANLSITLENGNTATVPLSDIVSGSDTNIAHNNLTLDANRTLTTGNFDLNIDANTLVIDGSANEVGIGVNNPTAKLDVNGTARIRTVNNGAATDNILTRDSSGNIRRRTAAEIVAAGGGSDDNIYSTSGTITGNRSIIQNNFDVNFDDDTFVIDGSTDNVGIGISNPNIDLAIGDNDTGLQQQGDGMLAIYSNNNERVRISNNGNVGIGTTLPEERLHVNGNSRLGTNVSRDGDFRLNEMGTGNRNSRIQFYTDSDTANDAEIIRNNGEDGNFIIDNEGNGIMYLRNRGTGQIRLGTNNTDDLFIEDGGNVGIGLSNPDAKLDVNGTARIRTVNIGDDSDYILTRDSSGNIRRRTAAQIVAAGGGGNDDNIYSTNGIITANRYITQNNFDLNFDANTLVIEGNENEVGIGTNSPTAKLDVNGTARIRTVNNGAATDNILTRDSSGNIRRRTAAEIVAAGGGSDDNIYSTSGTITGNRSIIQNNFDVNFDDDTFVIDGSTDNVGIGISNPNIDLAIGDNDTGLQQQGDGMLAIYSNNNERVRISNNGNVGIGTTLPEERLHVNGNSRLGTNVSRDGDFRLNEMGTGNRNSRIQFYTDSDTANDAEIIRNNGEDGNFIIDNEGNGIMYLRNRGTGQIRLGTNNTDDLIIEDGGNVGLGITAPTAKLDIGGTARIRTVNIGDDSDYILTRDSSGNIRRRTAAQIVAAGGGNDDNIYSTNGTITANRYITQNNFDVNFDASTLVIEGDENEVGIGTNSPTAKLDVNGTARIRTVNNGAATDNILTRDSSGNIRRRTAAEIVAAGGGSDDNIYSTSGTITGNRSIIQNNFDVNFDDDTFVIDGSTDNVGIGISNPNIDLAIGDNDTGLQQQGDGMLAIYSNNNERVRISNNGNVGIGTTLPEERLHVNGNSRLGTNVSRDGDFRLNEMGTGNRNSRIQFYTDSDTANDAEIIRNNGEDGNFIIDNEGNGIMYLRNRGTGQIRLGTNNTDDLFIEDGGNVGIGLSNPDAKLDVNGTARIRTVNIGDDSDYILTRDSSGNIRRRTAAQIVTAGGGSDDNFYSTSGTITGNRNIIQNNFDVNFDASTLVIEGNENEVGIGTSNPTAKLDVNGTARIRTVNNGDDSDYILTRDSSGNIRRRTAAQIVAAGGGNDDNIYSTNGTITGNRIVNLNTNTIDFSGSANDAFQVDGSTFTIDADTNRVGIGMTDPEERLNVNGTVQVGRSTNTHAQIATNRIETGRNTGSVALTANDSGGNANITFNNTSRIPDVDGNAARISVNVDSNINAAMSFEIAENVTAGTAITTSTGMRLTTTGLGIGTTAPTQSLDVNGNARVRELTGSGNRIVYADSEGVLSTRSTRSATFARGTSANYNSSDDWRRITGNSPSINVVNGDVILVNWSTIVKLTGSSTTDTLNFEVRLTGTGGCSNVNLSGGTFSEVRNDDSLGYGGTSGTASTCDGNYTIALWARNIGTDNWSYNESNITATVN